MEATKVSYNTIRPQLNLGGNTPQEIYNGLTIDFAKYAKGFKEQQALGILQNKKNICTSCL